LWIYAADPVCVLVLAAAIHVGCHVGDEAREAETGMATDGGNRDDLKAEPAIQFRWAWWLLAYTSLGLGILGIFVPGLPTTVFILISAWAAMRGSERLHRWLLAHRQFGPVIRNWQATGSVSRRAKWAATISMVVCALIIMVVAPKWWIAAIAIGCMMCVAIWLWLRPEPKSDHYGV
jgi:uncharacterized membrane protein YbaN (DUF454 family)